MKFSDYVKEQFHSLDKPLIENTINYQVIKSFIKQNISNTHDDLLTFPQICPIISKRLVILSIKIPDFINLLNSKVEQMNVIYHSYLNEIKNETKSETINNHLKIKTKSEIDSDSKSLIFRISQLESYACLNYQIIVKLLNKVEKHGGIQISKTYLISIYEMPFYNNQEIINLKQSLQPNISNTKPVLILKNMDWLPFNWKDPTQTILISLNGPHNTNLMSTILSILSKHQAIVMDLKFSELNHQMTFGVFIKLFQKNGDLFIDILKHTLRFNIVIKFSIQPDVNPSLNSLIQPDVLPINSFNSFNHSIIDSSSMKFMNYSATIIKETGISTHFLDDWTRLLIECNITVNDIKTLSIKDNNLISLDFNLNIPNTIQLDNDPLSPINEKPINTFREAFFILSNLHSTDVTIQPLTINRKHKRLVVFDMDSTLIQQEVIDEIAKHAGVVDKVSKITESAMNGEIDFKESLKRRVGLLNGTPVSVLEKVRQSLVFTPGKIPFGYDIGARELCKILKKLGYKLAVISGGFMPLALYVKSQLSLDYSFANQLETTQDGIYLTGNTLGSIVDAERKAELLNVISQVERIPNEQVIAVGDGANDLLMLGVSGLGIAFNAKPKVQKKANARINQKSLLNIMYLLGYDDQSINELLNSE